MRKSSREQKNPRLPRKALSALVRLCPSDRFDEVVGDLQEQFLDDSDHRGRFMARLKFWYEVLQFLRPSTRREHHILAESGGTFMISNYLKIASRHVKKHAGYTAINVAGLSVGLACFILIMLFVRFELSFDRFHDDSDHIYRVLRQYSANDIMGARHSAALSAPLGETIRDEIPEVEAVSRYSHASGVFEVDDAVFESSGLYADPTFFDVFSFKLVRGGAASALDSPNGVVLTESLARKLFGKQDPLGKTVRYRTPGGESDYDVTGVVRDLPSNSSITFEFLMPMEANIWFVRNRNAWSNRSPATFVRIRDDALPAEIEDKITAAAHSRMMDDTYYGERPDRRPGFRLQSLTGIHLYSQARFGLRAEGNIMFVYLFSAIALLILLIACINYMNIATARASTRAREIGIRKVAGAYRSHLVQQFLGESVLTALVAVLLGGVLARYLLPWFNQLIQRDITFSIPGDVEVGAAVIGIGIVTGFLAGSYPALVLSRFDPVRAFSGISPGRASGGRLRNLLVVGQFTATIALIIVTLVMRQQITYMLEKDTGLDRERVVTITIHDSDEWGNFDVFRKKLMQNPAVLDASSSYHLPTLVGTRTGVRDWEGKQPDEQLIVFATGVSSNFIDFFNLDLVEGRSFSDTGTNLGRGLIINETLRESLGWDSAVGKRFVHGSNGTEIVGVVRDFNFRSLEDEIQPLILYLTENGGRYVHAKIEGDNVSETLAFLGNQMTSLVPEYPFTYRFMDEAFGEMYQSEQRLMQLFGAFTIVALIIASLGLFGLATFSASRRRKEIGVRKVVGASITDIFLLLSKDFTLLVFIAFLIAAPISYIITQGWLQGFAYRNEPSIGLYLLVGGASLVVAWTTVAYQSISAARARPANVLRTE